MNWVEVNLPWGGQFPTHEPRSAEMLELAERRGGLDLLYVEACDWFEKDDPVLVRIWAEYEAASSAYAKAATNWEKGPEFQAWLAREREIEETTFALRAVRGMLVELSNGSTVLFGDSEPRGSWPWIPFDTVVLRYCMLDLGGK